VGVPLPAIFQAPDLPRVKHAKGSRPSGGGDRAASTELAAMPIDQSTTSTELRPRARAFGLSQLTWPSWLLVMWLAVVIWQVVRLGYQRYQLGQWLRQAQGSHDESLNRMLQDSARRLGLRRVPEIRFTDCECSPFVCGVWRPIVVLPGSLVTTLAAGQLRQVLLHELAHVKRNDLVWGWLPAIACVVYWFHPVAHWVACCNQFERELACDQLAIALSGQGAAGYANTLIEVASHASGGGLVIARGA
jgi:beta-lactamase regulating signal transducer with metallopeptidase domain